MRIALLQSAHPFSRISVSRMSGSGYHSPNIIRMPSRYLKRSHPSTRGPMPSELVAPAKLNHFEREARRCLSQTRPNNTTLMAVRMAPATMQMGVSAGKKSPLLSRMKAHAPASSISPQNPVATAGSMPLDPVDSFRGRSGTGSRANGVLFFCGLSVGWSVGMAWATSIRVPVYSGRVIFARATTGTHAFNR
jgi:hypothetical protein